MLTDLGSDTKLITSLVLKATMKSDRSFKATHLLKPLEFASAHAGANNIR